MPFGRALVDTQLLGDLSVRETLADEARDLSLSLGESWCSGPACGWKTKEATDLAHKGINIADVWEMRSSRKLDQARTADTRGNQLALRQGRGAIIFSVEHQRGSANLAETIGHVDPVAPGKELRCHLRRRRLALVFGKRSARRSRCIRSEDLRQHI
jgi:hypothetical protein